MDTLNPLLVALVIGNATEICNRLGKATTLGIKNLIRSKYPTLRIHQSEVSDIMMASEPMFSFKDLGTHREYTLSGSSNSVLKSYNQVSSTKSISKKKLAMTIMESPVVTEITWIKKNKEERTVKDFIPRGFTELGYIHGYTSEGSKSVDPRTLISATIGSTKYSCK